MEIKRDIYLNRLIDSQNNGLVKIVTGIRRCGKSFLLNTLFYKYLKEKKVPESHIIMVALDSEENKKFLKPLALTKYIKSKIKDDKTHYVILDEIQKLDDFVPVLNGLMRTSNLDLYVTGSNSKFLSSEIVTEFRGRGDEIHMYPLSFSEFRSAYKGDIYKIWNEYLNFGGLPLVLTHKTADEKSKYVIGQKDNTYINDVIERNGIKNEDNLNVLLQILASSVGSLVNPSKLSRSFKSIAKIDVPENTIKNYLKYLEEAFIIEKSLRFDVKGKQYMNTPSKYYFTDVGVRNAVLNFRQTEETHLMENVLFNELRIRGYNVDIGLVETRESVNDGKMHRKQLEIDFVANSGDKRYYIQSALSISNKEKKEQEIRSLKKVDDSFKKIIVVKDYVPSYHNEDGILIISLFDFLLNLDSLDK